MISSFILFIGYKYTTFFKLSKKNKGFFLQNPLFLYEKFKFYFYLGLFLLFQVGVAVES